MPDITISVPNRHFGRVIHALCASAGLVPETPQNAREALLRHIKQTVDNVERVEATRAALASVRRGEDIEAP